MLDALGGGLADECAVVAADITHDGVVKPITADTRRFGIDNSVQRDNTHLRGAAADIQHHRATRFLDRQTRANRGRHGLFDQVDLAGARPQRGFLDGAAFDLGGPAGHADQHPGTGTKHAAFMHLVDEILQHLFGDGEVGDDAILHGPNGRDVAGRPTQHGFGFRTHRGYALLPPGPILANGHHGGFIQHDALAATVDQRVCRAQINGQVGRVETA